MKIIGKVFMIDLPKPTTYDKNDGRFAFTILTSGILFLIVIMWIVWSNINGHV